mgnify:CR=1 FL=1
MSNHIATAAFYLGRLTQAAAGLFAVLLIYAAFAGNVTVLTFLVFAVFALVLFAAVVAVEFIAVRPARRRLTDDPDA